jgi:flagellar M-ring protein FliF
MATTPSQLEKTGPAIPGQPQWTDRLAGLWAQSKVRWAEMPGAQRGWAMAAAVLILALVAGIAWYGLRTDWRTLYADLDSDDARQVAQTLAQAQIPFEPTAGGSGILVPADQLDKARLATAAKGGVKSGRMGFEIFDKPNWVGSEFDEQVNFQRALEGELEHTVGSLADVESAQVHLVMPHESLFREQERPAKASVVLKLRHRSLADGEPDAIRNLVASAVDGLSPDRVVLVDAAGHLQLGPKTADGLRLTAEEALEEKLVSTLEPVTGAGNVRASVTLDYDAAVTDETQETYDPDQTVTLSMQRTEQSAGAQPVAGRGSRHRFECAQLAGAAGLPAADHAPADGQDRVRDLRGFEDRAPHHGESRPGAPLDGRHRGQRPAYPGRSARQGAGLAAALGRGAQEPDRAGPGGDRLRFHARRHGDGARPGFEENRTPSR